MVPLLLGGTGANKAIVVVESFLLLNGYRIHNLFFDYFSPFLDYFIRWADSGKYV